MKKITLTSMLFLISSVPAFATKVPTPLRDVQCSVSINYDRSSKLYTYSYTITSPQVNDSDVLSLDIAIDRDDTTDQSTPSTGLTQCPRFHRGSSSSARAKSAVVEVGSTSPSGWSCGYANILQLDSISYGWGGNSKHLLNPGKSLNGFVLKSFAPPGIRDYLVTAAYDVDQLPPEYYENVEKTVELENNVNWKGKTVGPTALPKVFDALEFVDYIRSLVDESLDLKWIQDEKFSKSLLVKIQEADKKIQVGDNDAARGSIRAFLNEVEAQKGKRLTVEGYELLSFNGKYLLDNLPKKGRQCSRKDRDTGHLPKHGKPFLNRNQKFRSNH
jgi:hypothetical protein